MSPRIFWKFPIRSEIPTSPGLEHTKPWVFGPTLEEFKRTRAASRPSSLSQSRSTDIDNGFEESGSEAGSDFSVSAKVSQGAIAERGAKRRLNLLKRMWRLLNMKRLSAPGSLSQGSTPTSQFPDCLYPGSISAPALWALVFRFVSVSALWAILSQACIDLGLCIST